VSERSNVKKSGHRILLYLTAIMLVAMAPMPASFARVHSHLKGARSSVHRTTPGSQKKVETNIPISVQHGEHDNARLGLRRFRVVPPRHTRVYPARPSVGSPVVGRNSIGLPIVRREAIQPDNAMPFNHPQPPFAPQVNGMSSFANRGLATPQFTVPRGSPPPPNLNGGRIGGAPLLRRPATGVGGPSTPVGGLNGTAFLRKP
jgi:hypothetical protein